MHLLGVVEVGDVEDGPVDGGVALVIAPGAPTRSALCTFMHMYTYVGT